jgi:hypothetical protein
VILRLGSWSRSPLTLEALLLISMSRIAVFIGLENLGVGGVGGDRILVLYRLG